VEYNNELFQTRSVERREWKLDDEERERETKHQQQQQQQVVTNPRE